MTTRLILVGGFLGAGKTTLLLHTARMLSSRGLRVGLVTNDQGDDLVDTALASQQQIPVTEVAGGCFCCRFPDLIVALRKLQHKVDPDVILAEPVGSCTDIVATVIRPLNYYYGTLFDIAPFTVLVDVDRQTDVLPAKIRYLHDKQMDDAEIIAVNKIDRLSAFTAEDAKAHLARLSRSSSSGKSRTSQSSATVLALSARTGQGIGPWLDTVMHETSRSVTSLEIDYARYADAEAALGWLNAGGTLRSDAPLSVSDWVQSLLQALDDSLAEQNAPIAHIKTHVTTPTRTVKASLTQSGSPPSWDPEDTGTTGDIQTDRAQFILNVRVNASPRALEQTVRTALEHALSTTGFHHDLTHFECFSPLPPQPTHRHGP